MSFERQVSERLLRWRPYPAYKGSGIEWLGEIPEHWEDRKLKHVASTMFSNVDKHTVDGEEPVRLCNYVDVYHNDYITSQLDFMEATATPEEITKFKLRAGDVIVTKDSEEWDDIAVPAYVAQDINSVLCGYHLALIRPDPNVVDGRYLFRAFASRGINDQFRVAATGITRYGLGKYELDNALLPVPPVPEQRAIADFLDRETARIDALISKKQRQIELLQEKRTALISHTVTKGLDPSVRMKPCGIEWLGEVPEHWEVWKVTHGFHHLGSGATPKSDDLQYYDGEIPWVTTSELRESIITETASKLTEQALRDYSSLRLYPPGTLLFAMYGATIGRMGFLGIAAVTNQACCAFVEPKEFDTRFVFYWFWMRRPILVALSSGGGQPNLSQDDLRDIRIPCPPIDEQRAIAAFLDRETTRIDVLVRKVKKSMELLREYRTALISAAVTGKVDVRREVA